MKEALKKLLWPKGIVTDNFTLTKRVRFIDYLNNISGKRFLDIGCGGGYFSKLLCEKGATGLGISVSEEAVNAARKMAVKYGLSDKVHFMLLNAKDIDTLGNHVFDVILCFEVLEHIFQDELVLQESSCLQPTGGLLLISVPNERSPIVINAGIAGQQPGHVRFGYSFENLEEILKKLGYQLIVRDSCGGFFTAFSEAWFRKLKTKEWFAKNKYLRLLVFFALRPLTFLDAIVPYEDNTIFVLAEKH